MYLYGGRQGRKFLHTLYKYSSGEAPCGPFIVVLNLQKPSMLFTQLLCYM